MNLIQFLKLAHAGSPLALPLRVRDLLKMVTQLDLDWDDAVARIPSEREARRCRDYFSRLQEAAPRIVGPGNELAGEIALAVEAIEDRLRLLEAQAA